MLYKLLTATLLAFFVFGQGAASTMVPCDGDGDTPCPSDQYCCHPGPVPVTGPNPETAEAYELGSLPVAGELRTMDHSLKWD
ncbi:hypothetical protein FB45DRAFT_1039694 [Roridomyces roridus]|uniref:Hydrophobin n=1 Tax=Roridomyces roridus TaxID=1738132 RepID=A0AAD7FAI6_9AGAR|nr:hypothetical protein FB45DRAFT_1039694 [Roridomyces roridus]